MTNQIELLPCPFCGGQAKVSSFPGAHNVWCENQPVSCGNRAMFTAEHWNRRADPAEDFRAVVEEPAAYADPRSFENFNSLSHLGGLYTHEWMWARPAAGLVPIYRHPQRPVVSQCSEVTPQCSEQLRTQAKLFPNNTVYPAPPRHTGFLLPDREEPGYTLEQMQTYALDCIQAFIQQNK